MSAELDPSRSPGTGRALEEYLMLRLGGKRLKLKKELKEKERQKTFWDFI